MAGEKMDRMASIEMALKNEKTEMDFYLHEARRSKNELARALFATCAKDEAEHMRRIKSLHERLLADGSWPPEMPIEVAGTDVKATLDNLVGEEGSPADHDLDDERALERAIAFEKKAMDFYQNLAGVCTNPAEKSFFLFLTKIEREHYLVLNESLFYLQDPEAWLEKREKSGLDGA